MKDAERYFKVNVFHGCLDIILAQLSNHFHSWDAIVTKFNVILLKTPVSAFGEKLYEDTEKPVKQYNREFSVALP